MALKILILTPRIPYPLKDGGSIAMNQTLEGYTEQECQVSLLSINTSRHWVDETTLPDLYRKLNHFESVYVKTDINPLSAFFNLFTDKSYNIERFVNKQFEQTLVQMLAREEYDIVQFESIYVASYLKTVRKHSKAKCICRVHNIEHLIWQRLTENERSFIKKKYLKLLTTRLKNYELDVLQKFDLLLPISRKEEQLIIDQDINQCFHFPFGVEPRNIVRPEVVDMNSCYHIGSMDWAPNVEGVEWLLNEVWPLAEARIPDIKLYLAGKNMPGSFLAKNGGRVEVVGEVDDFYQFSLSKNIMLVPLLSGAGIRIKILEGMSMGKTIISTSIGAEGIGATDHKNILIADSPEAFADALSFCFTHPDEAKAIGLEAQKFVLANFDKKDLFTNLVDYLTRM
ncbi:MAG: glycosyltransferase [Chitinophagaceae bacterium]|nr:glycosyltransferase [Chitinophagaceae bacterium]